MSVRAQVLFIILACVTVFYPSFSADISSIDDTLLVENLEKSTLSNPLDTFVRQKKSTLYYRPILGLTFWVDKNIFKISPLWMHLENVLFHLISTLLLFFIARILFIEIKSPAPQVPLFTALLWGLHPLTTESVNWISGRTDLLAGMFVLGATLLILHYRRSHKAIFLLLAAFTSLIAMLSKEVAVAFIPGAILILLASPPSTQSTKKRNNSRFLLFLTTLSAVIPLALFFIIRAGGIVANSSRIGITFQYMENNPIHSLMLFSRATGFYISKIFYPWPLNLAIMDVDPLFDLLAIPIVILCVWLLWNRSLLAAFLTGIILLTPSFLIVLNQIAWTPFAERYVYVSMAFIFIAIIGTITQYFSPQLKKITSLLLCGVILIFAFSSFQRSLVWHSNLTLLEDTATKSPYCKSAQWLYGVALAEEGNYEKAIHFTERACKLQNSPMDKGYTEHVNLGILYLKINRPDKALPIFNKVLETSNFKNKRALDGLLHAYSQLARETQNPEKSKSSYKEVQKNSILLYNINKDPFIWYNLGKLSLELKETERAREYFAMAHNVFPDDSPYKAYAKKLSIK